MPDNQRQPGENLYLIKKVCALPPFHKRLAESILEKDSPKYKVLRIIASNPSAIGYQGFGPGQEYHLVKAQTSHEAIMATMSQYPLFEYHQENFLASLEGPSLNPDKFSVKDAKKIDRAFMEAINLHTVEAVKKLFLQPEKGESPDKDKN